jgi:hypothetical protein
MRERTQKGRRWCVTAHLATGILERRKFLELFAHANARSSTIAA